MSINCIQLEKKMNNQVLLNSIDANFQKGLCHCICGENGSGKTTLLKIIAGLEKANSGQVVYKGFSTYSGSSPYMLNGTVKENIEYPLKLKRQGKRVTQDAVLALIDRLGLKGVENREANVLSSGEKQKVALARALVWSPDILLLDEPTANIDLETVEKIEKLLLDFLKDQSKTVLLVSHDLQQANRVSDVMWHLKNKKLMRQNR